MSWFFLMNLEMFEVLKGQSKPSRFIEPMYCSYLLTLSGLFSTGYRTLNTAQTKHRSSTFSTLTTLCLFCNEDGIFFLPLPLKGLHEVHVTATFLTA